MKVLRFAKNLTAHAYRSSVRRVTSAHAVPRELSPIDQAMEWLCRAQDATPNGGVSEAYHLYHGWLPSYPETTGYIIETFLEQGRRTGDRTYRDRAIRMADWLVSIQRDDGAIPDSYFRQHLVFDTGQVLFGLVAAFDETGEAKYCEAARRAGAWLVGAQDRDGAWRRHALNGIPHTYYSRVAWSLLALHRITDDPVYREAAIANLQWTVAQQIQSGWFDHAAFTIAEHQRPYTHTIAYVIRGLLEGGVYLEDATYIRAAARAIDGLLDASPPGSLFAGTYGRNWEGDRTFSCLTGNVQLAIITFKLAALESSAELFTRAVDINRSTAHHQNTVTADPNIRGALAGSSPVWGKYIHFGYPNWAAKFLAESLMIEERVAYQFDKLAKVAER